MKLVLLFLLVGALVLFWACRNRISASGGDSNAAALFHMVDALTRQHPFTREAVSRITGGRFRESGSNRYFTTFTSRGGQAPLREIELRLPTSASSKKDGILILSVDPAARIMPEEIEKRFGNRPELGVPEPAAPYEVSFSYPQSWGRLSFQFARGSRHLVAVILDAIEPEPAGREKPVSQESIGSAWMEADGTIVLQLRAEGPGGTIGDALLRYPKSHPQYESVLRHLGGLKTGEKKPVPPWPSR